MLGKLDSHMKKNETVFINIHKNLVKLVKDLNVTSEAITLSGKTTGSMLFDGTLSSWCPLGSFSLGKGHKSKSKHMGLYQTKNLPHSKGSHQQTKRQPNEREKIFANHVSDKGLISKMH